MIMDTFHVYFGLRWDAEIGDEREVRRLSSWEVAHEERLRKYDLSAHWQMRGDHGSLLVGRKVVDIDRETFSFRSLSTPEMADVAELTSRRLRLAGLDGEPAWHFFVVPDCEVVTCITYDL